MHFTSIFILLTCANSINALSARQIYARDTFEAGFQAGLIARDELYTRDSERLVVKIYPADTQHESVPKSKPRYENKS